MSDGTKIPLGLALPLAEKIKNALAVACVRVEIAGSVRRKKSLVSDIELVAIPLYVTRIGSQLDMFGGELPQQSLLDIRLDAMVNTKTNFRSGGKNGEKYKKFEVELKPGMWFGVDIFVTTPEQWGYIYALRTGPGDFNQMWVTQQSKGGVLPDNMHFSGGYLHQYGKRIDTPDEREFFETIGLGWIEPEQRSAQVLKNRAMA